MEKVMVIGCPGAGKSTFARRLRDGTGLPLYYLDMLWHRPDGTTVSREAFDADLERILEGKRWIIDGNYLRTMEVRLRACDTVFLLDYPVELCLAGARERVGKPREDMPWVERELDREFHQWILDFQQDQMPVMEELLGRYREKRLIRFHSREEAEEYLNRIEKIGMEA